MQHFNIIRDRKALRSADEFFSTIYNKKETQTSIQQYIDECKYLIKDDPNLYNYFDDWFKDLYTLLVISDRNSVLYIVKHFLTDMLEWEFDKYCQYKNQDPNITFNPTTQ